MTAGARPWQEKVIWKSPPLPWPFGPHVAGYKYKITTTRPHGRLSRLSYRRLPGTPCLAVPPGPHIHRKVPEGGRGCP